MAEVEATLKAKVKIRILASVIAVAMLALRVPS
jgi:hypothetical protein